MDRMDRGNPRVRRSGSSESSSVLDRNEGHRDDQATQRCRCSRVGATAHVGLETLGAWGWRGLNRDGSVRSGSVVWVCAKPTPMLSIGIV
jgi:hypothetical protein